MICYICGKKEWADPAGYGFQVNPCDKCQQPICENCVTDDYDYRDGSYRCIQWVCKDNQCNAVAA